VICGDAGPIEGQFDVARPETAVRLPHTQIAPERLRRTGRQYRWPREPRNVLGPDGGNPSFRSLDVGVLEVELHPAAVRPGLVVRVRAERSAAR
jgi:hypothetical protein